MEPGKEQTEKKTGKWESGGEQTEVRDGKGSRKGEQTEKSDLKIQAWRGRDRGMT